MDRNGSIRFEDFVIGLSVLLRGSVIEKLNWAFNLYDINKDGYITKEVGYNTLPRRKTSGLECIPD